MTPPQQRRQVRVSSAKKEKWLARGREGGGGNRAPEVQIYSLCVTANDGNDDDDDDVSVTQAATPTRQTLPCWQQRRSSPM
ncbi:hypothetical protein ACLKA7_015926 [Drosophila subpalustris]